MCQKEEDHFCYNFKIMILVTGGTGFIGSELVKRLATEDHPIRLLIRPSTSSPKIPRHVPVEIAVSSMGDEKGLKAAMKGVDTIIHLAGVERQGSHADLDGVDVAGTNSILQAVDPNRIKRFIYLSHIGADRSSAYPVMKAKAIAESAIQKSHVPYTIVRSAVVYGAGDQFTTVFTQLAQEATFFLYAGEWFCPVTTDLGGRSGDMHCNRTRRGQNGQPADRSWRIGAIHFSANDKNHFGCSKNQKKNCTLFDTHHAVNHLEP